jgi:phage terminase small subunit
VEHYQKGVSVGVRSARHQSIEKPLSDRQILFCEAYIRLGGMYSGKQAVIEAGYSNSNAGNRAEQLLTIPRIQKYIEERRSVLIEKVQVGLEYVLRKHKHVADEAIPEDKPLIKDFVSAGQTSLKEIAAITGIYAAEKRVNVNINGDEHLKRVHDMTEKYIEEHKKEY